MLKRFFLLLLLLVATGVLLTSCVHQTSFPVTIESDFTGSIYLYGERHGNAAILDKEYEQWLAYYNNQNMRHLFVEYPYFMAEFLNIWMKSDNDTILDEIFVDISGTASSTQANKIFLQKIKQNARETIFHGTDVGHQYSTTGKRYLKYLEQNGRQNSTQYSIAKENIEQGKKYYGFFGEDNVYRENMMVKNFIRELNSLNAQDIMGIYGSFHTNTHTPFLAGRLNTMATQLSANFDNIHIFDLAPSMQLDTSGRNEAVIIDEQEYIANLIGRQDMSAWSKIYAFREYWRVDNAYENVKNNPKPGEVLPYDNYPVEIKIGEVFMIKYIKPGGGTDIKFYRADGNAWNNLPVTERFEMTMNP